MKGYLILTVLIIVAFSCKKDSQNVFFSGQFVEKTPNINGSQLNFVNSNDVIITGGWLVDSPNTTTDTFRYKINNERITFISISGSQSDTAKFLFQTLGKDSLLLNSCTCACPANPFLLFIKE